jgi:ribonuclease Y
MIIPGVHEMTLSASVVLTGAGLFVGGALAGFWVYRWKERNFKEALALKEQTVLETAKREAETLIREARLRANEDALNSRAEMERQAGIRRQEFLSAEQSLQAREESLRKEVERHADLESSFREKTKEIERRQMVLDEKQSQVQRLECDIRDSLRRVANLNEDEARAALLKKIEEETLHDASQLARKILEEAKTRAEEKARRIIGLAIQRYAGEHTFENSTATVALSGDEMKGRIIGREGRNIRAFEAATGVTVLIDDTPNAVVLSGFDPVRREIARESMERLILDGRIHPTRIEEVVSKVTQEMDETILRAGEEAVRKAGLPPMHMEIIRVLGKLKFRHSFAQNLLDHSVEVAHLMGLMASELGIEQVSAKKAGLLHDIGKALHHEVEGAHAIVGADFIKRYGEPDDVVNGVASHHDEVPHVGILGVLVSAADAMSASRPGARSETMTTYIKRVENLEQIGMSFSGVERCFAVQAGRELRVIVQPEKVSDDQAFALARNIARKIEEDLLYPGQIRVTVQRETRCIEFAK